MASHSPSTALSKPNLNKLKLGENSFNEPGLNALNSGLSEREAQMARDSSQRLLSRLKPFPSSDQSQSVKMHIMASGVVNSKGLENSEELEKEERGEDKEQGEIVEIPAVALRLLVSILDEIADGNSVTLVPSRAELTTQQAAGFLNVSRPHLVRLLEAGAIPFHKAGTHRRVRFQDMLAYKAQADKDRHGALQELAALSQELDMGY